MAVLSCVYNIEVKDVTLVEREPLEFSLVYLLADDFGEVAGGRQAHLLFKLYGKLLPEHAKSVQLL